MGGAGRTYQSHSKNTDDIGALSNLRGVAMRLGDSTAAACCRTISGGAVRRASGDRVGELGPSPRKRIAEVATTIRCALVQIFLR